MAPDGRHSRERSQWGGQIHAPRREATALCSADRIPTREGMPVKSLARLGAIIVPLLLSTVVEAQAPARSARIGLLDYGPPSPSSEARWNALRERLHELGSREGRSVSFEVRWAAGRADRLSGLAAELVKSKATSS
jgi:hypothetical protein